MGDGGDKRTEFVKVIAACVVLLIVILLARGSFCSKVCLSREKRRLKSQAIRELE